MNNLPKILTLSFVGAIPASAVELHKQIQEELEPAAALETVAQQLTELADAHLIVILTTAKVSVCFFASL